MEIVIEPLYCATPLLQKEPIKKAAFITLGTRDVQLDRHKLEASGGILQRHNGKLFVNINNLSIEVREAGPRQDQPAQEGRLAIVAPREGGRLILEHWDTFREALCLPLIENFLKKMDEGGHWTILFVYTDQSVNSPHHANDTLYFKELARRYVQEKFSIVKNFNEIAIRENPADVDFQYDSFHKKFKENTFKEIIKHSEELWLLPQGGLDQVNQALTLQLILHARNKLRLFQQPENQDLKEIGFASKFLSTINCQIILDKAKRYDFKGILDFKDHTPRSLNWLIKITELAQKLLQGTFYKSAPSRKEILNILENNLKLRGGTPAYDLVEKFLTWNEKKIRERPTEPLMFYSLYYSLRIAYLNEEWEDFLAQIFRISENALSYWMERHYKGSDPPILNFKKLRDENLRNKPEEENQKLLEVLEKICQPCTIQTLRSKKIFLNNPSFHLLAEIFDHLKEELFEGYNDDLRRRIRDIRPILGEPSPSQNSGTLRDLRNKMEHRLGRIQKEDILKVCGSDESNLNKNLNNLLETLEILCDARGFEFFEKVVEAYKAELGPE